MQTYTQSHTQKSALYLSPGFEKVVLDLALSCILTSWRKTNPEIPATNSARKTSDRNMAYYTERKRKSKREICIVCMKTLTFNQYHFPKLANTHTHTNTEIDSLDHH